MSEVQIYNRSDKPIGPITYGGRDYVFQPDPDKAPGTWKFNGWEIDRTINKIKRDGNGKLVANWVKISDDSPLSNVESVPEDFKNTLQLGSVMADFYTEHLVVDKQVVNMLKLEKIALEQEIAKERAEFEKMKQRMQEEAEAHRIQLLKDQASLKAQLDAQRSELTKLKAQAAAK